MRWKTDVDKSWFLSADKRILLALYLVNQEKPISWLTGWLAPDYDGKNVYSTLSRLVKRQSTNRIYKGSDPATWTEGSDPLYQITRLGIVWLGRRFPLIVKEGSEGSEGREGDPTSAQLAAAVIDAAEVRGRRRKLLFDELKKWRYGRLSRGVYLTGSAAAQAAVADFVGRYRLAGYINLMAVTPAENPKILADRVFRLTDRNAAWRLLIDRMFEWSKSSSRTQTGLRRIRNDFLEMLVTEPGLPPELKPADYWMEKAINKVLK